MAFFGSLRILTSISSVSFLSVNTTGRRPKNSGIIPNSRRSSNVTFSRMSGSSSYLSFRSALKPIDDCLLSLALIMSSRSGKAPPHMKSIFLVFTVVSGTMAFLELAPTGTSTSLPSSILKRPCCTDSPLTSRLRVSFFLAILSISSIKIIPRSALSTSLSAAARSFDTTLSISSPMYPASVSDVASVIASGTSRSLASVCTRYVLPEPVGPIISILDFWISMESIVFVATLL